MQVQYRQYNTIKQCRYNTDKSIKFLWRVGQLLSLILYSFSSNLRDRLLTSIPHMVCCSFSAHVNAQKANCPFHIVLAGLYLWSFANCLQVDWQGVVWFEQQQPQYILPEPTVLGRSGMLYKHLLFPQLSCHAQVANQAGNCKAMVWVFFKF